MFNPFSALTSKIYGAAAIAALVVAGAQTLRIEGALCREAAAGEYSRCLVTGFRQDVADRDLSIDRLVQAVTAEQAAHQQTKLTYQAAQAEAAKLEQARLDRAHQHQQEITDDVTADYRRRLADARAVAERLRHAQVERAGASAAGEGAGEPMPAAGDPAGRADGPTADPQFPSDERLVATEQAIQLDALISWVERQQKVEINP